MKDYQVDLVPLSVGPNSVLDPGQICINAQEDYRKAKYRAVVKPVGTTAHLTATHGLTFPAGTTVQDNEVFWVHGADEVGDGSYGITIAHKECPETVKVTKTSGLFRFKFAPLDAIPGIHVGDFGPEDNTCHAATDADHAIVYSSGYQNYTLKVVCDPSSSAFSGVVTASAQVSSVREAAANIKKAASEDGDTAAVGISFGIFSFSFGGGGSKNIAAFAGGWSTGFQGVSRRLDVGSFEWSSDKFSVPYAERDWKQGTNLLESGPVGTDMARDYTVGVTKVHFDTLLEVKAKTTRSFTPDEMGPGGIGTLAQGADVLSPSGIALRITEGHLHATEEDGVFDIKSTN